MHACDINRIRGEIAIIGKIKMIMKKKPLIIGLVFIVIGIALLAFAQLPRPMDQHQGSYDIPSGYYYYFLFDVEAGTRLEFSFSSNCTVYFGVMDSQNYEKYKAGESFTTIREQLNTSTASFAFETPKTDKYYFLIENVGKATARASVIYAKSTGWGTFTIDLFGYEYDVPISYVGAVFIIIGAIRVSLVVLRKPKISPQLLDLVKTRGRIKIDQLAQELQTTEARVETGVYELMRAGHPIRFEAETREVVYG